jgi:hypothetical protein
MFVGTLLHRTQDWEQLNHEEFNCAAKFCVGGGWVGLVAREGELRNAVAEFCLENLTIRALDAYRRD